MVMNQLYGSPHVQWFDVHHKQWMGVGEEKMQ
jgi:hypothetical protein